MKTKPSPRLWALALALCTGTSALASSDNGPLAVVADTTVVRPACLVVTAVGSVFFVVSLPFAAASKSVKKTAHTLVVQPAKATFCRPLGDLDSLTAYN